MNKRIAAGLLAGGMTATVLGVVSAQPAAAATPCGVYPPGQSYSMSRAPGSGIVSKGTVVGTRGTLRRGHQACVGFELAFYVKPASIAVYRLRAHGPSDGTGSFRASFAAGQTFRFQYQVRLSSTAVVRSSISEIRAI